MKNINHTRDRKSGSAGMPRPISYAVFCLKKKKIKNDQYLYYIPSPISSYCNAAHQYLHSFPTRRSSDLGMKTYNWEGVNPDGYFLDKLEPIPSALPSFQKLFQVSATALSIP